MMSTTPVTGRRWPLIASVVVITSIAAACTSQESSDPGPTLTSLAATTTTTVAASTTVPTASTTLPETTTTAAPTTTVAPPTGPIDASIPLLVGGESGNWLSLGTWQVDRWASAFDDDGEPITPNIGGEPTFTITGLSFPELSGTVGPNGEACFDGREGPSIEATVPPPEPAGFGYSAIALPNSWPLRPRPVAQVSAGVPAYQQLGEDAFAGAQVDASLGNVRQIVVADLDGDGDDEAIVGFERVENADSPGSAGDLAAMLLVDTTSRSSQTIISNNVEGDGSEADFFPIIERYRVLDVADLNGDGRMEVVIHAWYYEGASVIVYEYDGTSLIDVLATGCGS